MPTGVAIRRRLETNFTKQYDYPLSSACSKWLAYIETSQEITIQHARNNSEYKANIGRSKLIPVDGYCL